MQEIKEELTGTQNALDEIIGQKPSIMRPPFGAIDEEVIKAIENENGKIILWSIDTLDWSQKEATNIIKNVKDNLQPGDIILMHCNGDKSATAEALPDIIKAIQDKGYKIATLDQMESLNKE